MKHVVIIGPQGSGKGTQAARIAPEFNLVHLATGDLFRDLMKHDNPLSQEVRKYYDRGDLVPDDLTAQVLFAALDDVIISEPITGALFDGYPRNSNQARVLAAQIASRGEKLAAILHLSVPHDVLMRRIASRGRSDDNLASLERRLQIYYSETEPLLDAWRRQGLVLEIDGDQTIEAVSDSIRCKLSSVLCRDAV